MKFDEIDRILLLIPCKVFLFELSRVQKCE